MRWWAMEEIIDTLFLPTTQIAVIIALAEVIKSLGLDIKYIPLVDVVLGLASGIFVYWGTYDLTTSIMIGIIYGLSACGAFSGYKNLTKKGDK